MQQNILVTGGLGFIGSHTIVCLHEAGYVPVIIDNLHNSRIEVLSAIEKLIGYTPNFIQGDVNDKSLMTDIFQKYQPEAVIHFAAHKAVGESVEQPLMYYHNNVVGLVTLLEVMKQAECKKLVFSSSCTVYGEPEHVPVKESTPTRPAASPYGATKQMGEVILKDNNWCQVQCLRYFNPVGAHESGFIGENPNDIPNNLMPYLLRVANGTYPELKIFGNNYNTIDGTCIRDFIHVVDLAKAHVKSLEYLPNSNLEIFNISSGIGTSVMELVNTFMKVNNISLPYKFTDRREGDIEQLYANPDKANNLLKWKTEKNINDICRDSYNFIIKN